MYRVIWRASDGDYLLSADCYPLPTDYPMDDATLCSYEFDTVEQALAAVETFCDDPAVGVSSDDRIEIVDWSDAGQVVRRFSLDVEIRCSCRESL